MNNLFLKSKKIHRIAMFITIALALVMSGTGLFMKYVRLANKIGVNLSTARELHNVTSTLFSITLFTMIATGLVMYMVPLKKSKKKDIS